MVGPSASALAAGQQAVPEALVFNALMGWLGAAPERQQHLDALLRTVRLEAMSAQELAQVGLGVALDVAGFG